jgi:thioredoxin 1
LINITKKLNKKKMALEVTNENIEETLNKKKLTILQFSAEWCGPCKMLTPIMLKLAEENLENDVTIGKVNVDTNSDIGAKYSVRNIPTLVFLKNGIEIERTTGLQTKDSLQTKINTFLN